ncbi:MAG: amino acid permease, partial [Staphylococcus xylosus]|nr:amino acid permease [Staphylococcus xylosus]
IVSFIFLLLLLVPGSPASLSLPSYIALGGWLVIGLIFFVVRYPKLKRMDNDKLSRLILNRSEDDVVDLINEH